jgi:hypothetical protein
VAGMLDDARNAVGDAVGARVDQLRDEVDDRLAKAGGSLKPMLVTVGILIVAGGLASAATAASLIALGAPPWAALWGVAAVAAGAGLLYHRRSKAAADAPPPTA